VLRQARLLDIGVVGAALLLAAVTQAWIRVAVARSATGVLPAELMVVNGLLFLFAALGLHLPVFEEMAYELRIANRRLQETQTKLHGLAITDSLTGCYNRRFFHEVIGRELQRHERHDVPLAILFVDIEHFKMVNDTLGHDAGDRLLEYVALFLKGHVREADYVFRWGGDESLMLLSCTLEEAREKGADLATAFRTALTTSGLPTGVDLSVGSSEVIAPTDDIMERIQEADNTMYRHKQGTESRSGD
jgi:diguanylate cyclase (GGDEF)-like protein